MRRPFSFLLIAVSAAFLGQLLLPSVAHADAQSPEYQRATRELSQRLAQYDTPRERAQTILNIAAYEKPTGVMGDVVQEWIRKEALGQPSVVQQTFLNGTDDARLLVLQLYYDEWNILGRGTGPWLLVLIRHGLQSENPEIRRAAARLGAERPVPRIGHDLIDATTWDPTLRMAALLGIALNSDWRPVRWVVGNLETDDPTILAGTKRAIWRIGRRAATHLHERIASGTPEMQRRSLEALLLIATNEDTGVFYRWIESADPEDELTRKVNSALAALEIGNYRAETPERPALTF